MTSTARLGFLQWENNLPCPDTRGATLARCSVAQRGGGGGGNASTFKVTRVVLSGTKWSILVRPAKRSPRMASNGNFFYYKKNIEAFFVQLLVDQAEDKTVPGSIATTPRATRPPPHKSGILALPITIGK